VAALINALQAQKDEAQAEAARCMMERDACALREQDLALREQELLRRWEMERAESQQHINQARAECDRMRAEEAARVESEAARRRCLEADSVEEMIQLLEEVSPKLNSIQWAEGMSQVLRRVVDSWLYVAKSEGEAGLAGQATQIHGKLLEAISVLLGQLKGALEMGQELQGMLNGLIEDVSADAEQYAPGDPAGLRREMELAAR